jgi:hypothetical protein
MNPSLHYSTFRIIPAPKSHERPTGHLRKDLPERTCCESKNSSTSSRMPRFQRKRMKEKDSWKERKKERRKEGQESKK